MSLIPSRGRPSVVLGFRLVRPLNHADILRIARADGIPRVGVPLPQRLRQVHHRAAELLAAGVRITDIAHRIGLTPQRITQLQEDPSFCELVAYFSDQHSEHFVDIKQRVEDLTIDNAEMATLEINRRLETEVEKIGITELRNIAAMSLDRTLLPPKPAQSQTPPTMNVTFKIGTRDIQPKIIEEESEVVREIESKDE